MKLTFGYSPCPNDTFIFYALEHKKIDTFGLDIDVQLADVEQLNQWAFNSVLDCTKLSYHAFAYVSDRYILSPHGSALGNACGPLLICKNPSHSKNISQEEILIPGKYTTANFLLHFAYPEINKTRAVLFSDIENQLTENKASLGVIIHENRFTYAQKGLHKIADLGSIWEEKTHLPIPLGGIAFKRNLPEEIKQKLNIIIHQSVLYALEHPEETMSYVRTHAQEMDEVVMKQHIDLYVNDFTKEIGSMGEKAVSYMFEMIEKNQAKVIHKPYFYTYV
jgi:1,4-dihydroxy-6-naphthoate synthase